MGRVSFGPLESCSWRVPLGERLYGYSGPWPVFAAFPPLAKSDYVFLHKKSRTMFVKIHNKGYKKSRREFRRDGGAVSGHKKPLGRGAGRE